MIKSSLSRERGMSSRKLSRDLWLLIAFGAFRTISDLFLGTFFVSFLMNR